MCVKKSYNLKISYEDSLKSLKLCVYKKLQALSDATGEIYYAVEGMDYKIEFNDTTAVETTTIDYSKVYISELQEIGVVEPGDVDYIGIEETIKLNEDSGFICTEK